MALESQKRISTDPRYLSQDTLSWIYGNENQQPKGVLRYNLDPQRPNSNRSASAPAWLLDEFEELRMNLSDDQLTAEAIAINHGDVKEKTAARYEDHLVHFSQYLASAHGLNFYSAKSKHVRLFM